MVDKFVPDSTKHATKFRLSMLTSFCCEKGLNLNLASYSVSELDNVLHKFMLDYEQRQEDFTSGLVTWLQGWQFNFSQLRSNSH